jgi:membrane fusion protein (multidrug efflux system)
MRSTGIIAAALLIGFPLGARAEELECLIQPKVTVSLATPVEGVIREVLVGRGDQVKHGELLVELESRVERAVVERTRTTLRLAERTYARSKELNRTNVISAQVLDDTEADRDLARHDLARAEAALALRMIRSPIDGVVMEQLFFPGEFADNLAILELAELDPLYVEVYAPVSMLGRIAQGMVAQVTPEEPVGGSYEAAITVIDPVVDAASGTFGVRLELPNPDYAIPAGLNCAVRFPDTPVAEQMPRERPPPEEMPAARVARDPLL